MQVRMSVCRSPEARRILERLKQALSRASAVRTTSPMDSCLHRIFQIRLIQEQLLAISYQLLANSFVNLRTYDVLGREVAVLVEGVRGPGSHTVHWNASSMPSGVYILSLQVSDGVLGTKQYYVATQKMVLLK